MTTNIIIPGILGRMGREIARIVSADSDMALIGGTEVPDHTALGSDIGESLGLGTTGIPVTSSLKDTALSNAVIIDFTSPASTRSLLEEIKGTDTRIVIGTTGLNESDMTMIKETARTNAVLFSPNMSLGVNFLFYLTRIAAEKLGSEFDIEIIETHHRYKKDAPSGTAKRLGEIASAAMGNSFTEVVRNGRSGLVGERTTKEIGMHAVRGGDIVGDHTVLFAGPGEQLELKHRAHSRTTFAQ
ncbi:MAG: 4-hydroxy-tetrahydrodipicolinate reductase, partial [bacterium]|nr:4-hydroxy-tetrahydrodipicolinate reductase [bacterium]